jgi:ribokinase
LPLTDILVVNESELGLLTGHHIESGASDAELTDALADLAASPPQVVIITLGAQGLVIARGDDLHRIAGEPARIVDTTGAGDCLCGYLAAGLARGDSLELAAIEANVAASIAVQSLGAASSVPSRSTIMPAIAAAQSRGS